LSNHCIKLFKDSFRIFLFISNVVEFANMVSSNQPYGKKIFHVIRRKKNQMQIDILNFQKFHQIARSVEHDDTVTRYAIPYIIKWLRELDSIDKMR